jgi:hypothetical protein
VTGRQDRCCMSLEASLSYSIHYAPRSFLLRIAKAMELKTRKYIFSWAQSPGLVFQQEAKKAKY